MTRSAALLDDLEQLPRRPVSFKAHQKQTKYYRYKPITYEEVHLRYREIKSAPTSVVFVSGFVEDSQELERRFKSLADKWRQETLFESSMATAAMNDNYQQIIGMGPGALPFILRDLAETGDHWFWALKMITGVDPVPPEARGHVDKMCEKWLEWGRQNNYL